MCSFHRPINLLNHRRAPASLYHHADCRPDHSRDLPITHGNARSLYGNSRAWRPSPRLLGRSLMETHERSPKHLKCSIRSDRSATETTEHCRMFPLEHKWQIVSLNESIVFGILLYLYKSCFIKFCAALNNLQKPQIENCFEPAYSVRCLSVLTFCGIDRSLT